MDTMIRPKVTLEGQAGSTAGMGHWGSTPGNKASAARAWGVSGHTAETRPRRGKGRVYVCEASAGSARILSTRQQEASERFQAKQGGRVDRMRWVRSSRAQVWGHRWGRPGDGWLHGCRWISPGHHNLGLYVEMQGREGPKSSVFIDGAFPNIYFLHIATSQRGFAGKAWENHVVLFPAM